MAKSLTVFPACLWDCLQLLYCAGAGRHKAQIVEGLPGGVCCVGNGFNDIPMFGRAALSVAVIGHEGACGALLAQADVVVTSIDDALDLLLRKGRLTATLRS